MSPKREQSKKLIVQLKALQTIDKFNPVHWNTCQQEEQINYNKDLPVQLFE